jgi:hypothetical protein
MLCPAFHIRCEGEAGFGIDDGDEAGFDIHCDGDSGVR